MTAFGNLESSRAQIAAAQAQVSAAETALNGVREEAKVGQRTTLDVLNAQQSLLVARSTLVTAQRDRVVASYSLLSAVGRLNAETLGCAWPAMTRGSTTIRSATSGSGLRRLPVADHPAVFRPVFLWESEPLAVASRIGHLLIEEGTDSSRC